MEFMTMNELNTVIKNMGVGIPLKVMTKLNENYLKLLSASFEMSLFEKDVPDFVEGWDKWDKLVNNYVEKYMEMIDMFTELGVKCHR